jgi:hypothetical protein
MNNLVAFGSSTIMYDTAYPSLIAQKLNFNYVNKSKPTNSNHKIARMILSYNNYQPGDVVLAEWTSTRRHEWRTELGWAGSNMATYPQGSGTYEDHYYQQGPGQWEYNGVYTALKEIILAQTFLKNSKIDYLFTFFPDEVLHSMLLKTPDEYIGAMLKLIDWNQFILFDGHGFVQWCRINNYEFEPDGNHPAPSAHSLGAEYILKNFKIND